MAKSNSKTLFVGGLSIYIGEQELYQYFGTFSKVLKVVFLRERESGKSKGYAFVTLKDADAAFEVAAMKHVILGRQIECQIAARKCEKLQNSHERMKRKLYVTNITPHLSDDEFQEYFSAFGEVHNSYIIKNPELNCNRNYGFVEFEDLAVTEYLLNLQTPLVIRGVRIYIHPFKDKDQVKHHVETYTTKDSIKKSKPKKSTDNQTQAESPASNGAVAKNHHNVESTTQINKKNPSQVPILTPSTAQVAPVHQSPLKKPLKFSQKYPIKGEAKPNERGDNYYLRASHSGKFASNSKHFALFDQNTQRYQLNGVTPNKCGHCQHFHSIHIVSAGCEILAEPSTCSCQVTHRREFSLFFKGSGSDRPRVGRQKERAEKSGSRDRVNTVHGSTSSC